MISKKSVSSCSNIFWMILHISMQAFSYLFVYNKRLMFRFDSSLDWQLYSNACYAKVPNSAGSNTVRLCHRKKMAHCETTCITTNIIDGNAKMCQLKICLILSYNFHQDVLIDGIFVVALCYVYYIILHEIYVLHLLPICQFLFWTACNDYPVLD